MAHKLIRHGDDLALVIDRGLLETLDIGEDTPLELSTDGRALVVFPTGSNYLRRVESAGRRTLRTHRDAFARLARR